VFKKLWLQGSSTIDLAILMAQIEWCATKSDVEVLLLIALIQAPDLNPHDIWYCMIVRRSIDENVVSLLQGRKLSGRSRRND
jgi:hypothetical protein